MSTIVLVHGIAQEQLAADILESQWIPALAGGIRNSGSPALADQIWRDNTPGALSVRMAYYGSYFLDKNAQGYGADFGTLDPGALDLAEALACAWLENAADYAANHNDRAEAQRQLADLAEEPEGAQGAKALLRPGINGLARLRWFAPLGVGLAGQFVFRALSQVTRYLTEDPLRSYAQQQVLDLIDTDTKLVVGHSLGSVVAYEALHNCRQPTALLTLGSPLGLRNIVYDRLRPKPSQVPSSVIRWDNLVDRDDLVAAHLDLAPYFKPAPGSTVTPRTAKPVDNGSRPHEASHYLTKSATGKIISDVLT